MDKYTVKMYSRVYSDLDNIYEYIASHLQEPGTGLQKIDQIENTILSLEEFPERGSYRKTGTYSGRKYRQLFVKNYVIIYKVIHESMEVHIVTVRYAASDF